MWICISSAIAGFRRGGVSHPTEPTAYPRDYFSEKQIEQIKAEPRLAVQLLDELPEGSTIKVVQAKGAVETSQPSADLMTATLDGVKTADRQTKDLGDLTVAELRAIAKGMAIEGFEGMRKTQLLNAIQAQQVETVKGNEA